MVRAGKTLGVRPARVVARTPEREQALQAALTVLYRDFFEGGGLDELRAQRAARVRRRAA